MSMKLSVTACSAEGKPHGDCPHCGGRLEVGNVAVHGTFWGWILVGWSYQQLWFQPHLGEERRVLQSGESRQGWRCADCGFVGVASPGKDAGRPGYKYFGSSS